MNAHIKALQAQTDKALISLGGKSLEDDRAGILDDLSTGNHHAMSILRDWHEDNPGHAQHEMVGKLHDYVHGGASEEEKKGRAIGAHGYLTDDPEFREGEPVVHHGHLLPEALAKPHITYHGTIKRTGKPKMPIGVDWHTRRMGDEILNSSDDGPPGRIPSGTIREAAHHLSQNS